MRPIVALTLVLLPALLAAAQTAPVPAFEVASVKRNARPAGRDARGRVTFEPNRVSARNVSLRDLVMEAYGVEPYQVMGGPGWFDVDEFDIDARAAGSPGAEQLRRMLQTLLAERFHLALHKETRELRGYALRVDSHGPRLHGKELGDGRGSYHGDMRQLVRLISVQLTIPAAMDPSQPVRASGVPVPVVNETGLDDSYTFTAGLKPELGTDPFVLWQRVLQEQLGLKLAVRKVAAECIVVERADRTPGEN